MGLRCLYPLRLCFKDDAFFSIASEDWITLTPSFETFAVSCPSGGKVERGYVYEWLAETLFRWRDRALWVPEFDAEMASRRIESLTRLHDDCWQQLWDICLLVPRLEGKK